MAFRFGRTYSRRGPSEEGTSRFDEVASHRRGTLTTKWGATTYRAALGPRRPGPAPSGPTPSAKRTRPADDPFGFDSDEESHPVSSRGDKRGGGTKRTPTKPEPPSAERPHLAAVHEYYTSSSPDDPAGLSSSSLFPNYSTLFASSATLHSHKVETQRSWDDLLHQAPPPQPSHDIFFQGSVEPSGGGQGAELSYLNHRNAPSSSQNLLSSAHSTSQNHFLSHKQFQQAPPPSDLRKVVQKSRKKLANEESVLHGFGDFRFGEENKMAIKPHSEDFCFSEEPIQNAFGDLRYEKNTKTKNQGPVLSDFDTHMYTRMEEAVPESLGLSEKNKIPDHWTEEPVPDVFDMRYNGNKKTASDPNLDFFQDLRQGKTKNTAVSWPEDPVLDVFENFTSKKRNKMSDKPVQDISCTSTLKEKKTRTNQEELLDTLRNSRGKDRTINSETKVPEDPLDLSEDRVRLQAKPQQAPPPLAPPKKADADSYRRIFSAQKQLTRAVYNARHWTVACEEGEEPTPSMTPSSSEGANQEPSNDDALFKAPPPPSRLTGLSSTPPDDVASTTRVVLHVASDDSKQEKKLRTLVRRVKDFNEVVEFGENQEFMDDIVYFTSGLQTHQPLNIRCLSVINLAERCTTSSFRMHVRARGTMATVFQNLQDAPQHPNLALCTASLMYVLSQDRLHMDLDRAWLALMIQLLAPPPAPLPPAPEGRLSNREASNMRHKICKLFGPAHKHLDLHNLTARHLAMETLLSLASKRAGDWFKEELRLLGGLDPIVDKVKECVDELTEDNEDTLVASLRGMERCSRVLESVQSPENQRHLIAYGDSVLIVCSARALTRCEELIQRYCLAANASVNGAVGKAVEECTRALLILLTTLTQDNEWGATKTGQQGDFVLTLLSFVLRVPRLLPQEQRFDIRILGLGLLINLVENSARNKYFLLDALVEDPAAAAGDAATASSSSCQSGSQEVGGGSLNAIDALVQFFLQCERAAVAAEAQTDDLIKEAPQPAADQSGEWQESGGEIQWVEKDQNDDTKDEEKGSGGGEEAVLDLSKALQHAGKHMEDSIVASYTALLLGCACQGNSHSLNKVRLQLPKEDFSIMTELLKKFLDFMNLVCIVTSSGRKTITRIIDYLEAC